MTRSRSSAYLGSIQRIFEAGTEAGASDAQLLERFVVHHDDSAFESLVSRHGPLVLGVCRGVLGKREDVDDAFQATFLVLAAKAHRLSVEKTLGSWLYRVALRIALHAKTDAQRRRRREHHAVELQQTASAPSLDPDLRELLLEEVDRLPERYRAPVLLCHFRGFSLNEAASSLGCPPGTVSGRLTRARHLLRSRLTRRGVSLSSSLLASTLAAVTDARAAVPGLLEETTVEMAVHLLAEKTVQTRIISTSVALLMKGAMRSMLLSKARIMGATFLTLALVTFGAMESRRMVLSAGQPERTPEQSSHSSNAASPPEAGAMVVDRITASELKNAEGKIKVDAVKHCIYLPKISALPEKRPRDGAIRIDLERGKIYKITASDGAFMSEEGDPFPGVVLYYNEDTTKVNHNFRFGNRVIRQKILERGQSVTFRTPWVINPQDEVFLLAFFLSDYTKNDHRGGYTLTITEAEGAFDLIPQKVQRVR